MTIILPSGYRINLENQTTYSPGSPTTVVFTFAVGIGTGTWTETFLTAETAANFILQLDALVGRNQNGITSLTGSPTTLISVSPNPFAMHGGDYILVNGNRFEPDTIGFLYLNDVGTPPDFLGYKMACTYISPTQVSAVWVSDGSDTNVLPNVVAYYRDLNNLVSNVLTDVFLSDIVGLTFASLTPNTSTAGDTTFSGALAGTGFLGSGIDTMKVDDGAGHSIPCSFSIDSDIKITLVVLLGGGAWPAVTTYTVYYSTNGGGTWTTTGKSITVS